MNDRFRVDLTQEKELNYQEKEIFFLYRKTATYWKRDLKMQQLHSRDIQQRDNRQEIQVL